MGRRPDLADPSHERHPTRASCMFSDTLYILTIIGVWNVLGAIAILVLGFARLKEWAYAGTFFTVTGAAASHWAVGDYGVYAFHVLVNLFVAALVVASWVLRPQSRTLGSCASNSAHTPVHKYDLSEPSNCLINALTGNVPQDQY